MATTACSICQRATPPDTLAQAHSYAFWRRADGACPACLQQSLLRTLLESGEAALHESIQRVWPLDAEAAFGALPTLLRLHADPRFAGRGVTIALLDSGFYPHADLVRPMNRIRAWADATVEHVPYLLFSREHEPRWPGWNASAESQWHGTMTSVVAAGNGFLSHGLYRGLASEAQLVLIQVRDAEGHISSESIARALAWLKKVGPALGVRVVSMSVSGDPVEHLGGNPVDAAAEALIDSGVSLVAAAGNSGERQLIPPATSPRVLTIGGIDDHSSFSHEEIRLWHSNYGQSAEGLPKPELVAPSLWVAAPVLPGTSVGREAAELFARRARGDSSGGSRISEMRLITPHYQHAEGTSFAAPIVASAVACMLEANSSLTPVLVRDVLRATAHPVPGASVERQGAGALDAGRAVAGAMAERHTGAAGFRSPEITPGGMRFALHDHDARSVSVLGSWDAWQSPGLAAARTEDGVWQTASMKLAPGNYTYKFLLDGTRWLDDPANPAKAHDGLGGLNSVFRVARR